MFKKVLLPVNIKQFEAAITLDAVKKFLTENKEQEAVKTYLGELSAVSADKVTGFLDTDEGKKLLQPRLDTYFTNGLKTWKANNLEALIIDEVNKRNPKKTPEQIKIEELTNKIEIAEKARIREGLVNKALKVAKEKSLPDGVIDFFIGEDEAGTLDNLKKFEEEYTKAVQAAVDVKFKENGRIVSTGGGTNTRTIDIGALAEQASIRK